MPKIFRMTSGGKLTEGLFKGETINTPSMLCVSDYLTRWPGWSAWRRAGHHRAQRGQPGGDRRLLSPPTTDRISGQGPATRSNTSVCLSLKLAEDQVKKVVKLLEAEGVAYDIGAYKDAPCRHPHLVRRHGREQRPAGPDALAELGLRKRNA